MYNSDLKTRFIREYTDVLSIAEKCKNLFNSVEKYEIEWGADICTVDKERISTVLSDLVGLRTKNQYGLLKILRTYSNWCIKNGVENACDSMLNINDVGLEKIRNQMVSSPLHLDRYLNEICDERSLETTDMVIRCYCWLAYMGFSEDEILNIKVDDVDFDYMVVRHNNKEAPIYRESLLSFKQCVKTTSFLYINPTYKDYKYKDRISGDLLLRGLSQPQKHSLRGSLCRNIRESVEQGRTTKRLSLYRIWLSGVFYRAYELERVGCEPDFKNNASEFIRNKQLSDIDLNKKMRRVAKEYLDDYERWKLAFSI